MKSKWLVTLSWACMCGLAQADLVDDGWVEYEQGSYEAAYDLFFQAFRESPDSIAVNFALAEAARKKGKFSHAVFAYERVLMLQPAHQKALYGKGLALWSLHQVDEARADFEQLLTSDLKSNIRGQIEDVIAQIDESQRRWGFVGQAALSFFHDDNINVGPTSDSVDTLFGTLSVGNDSEQADTLGMGLSLSGSASYDFAEKGGWGAVGGVSLYKTELDSASAQELMYNRLYMGVRHVEQRRLVEWISRYDRLEYGQDHLLDVYGTDLSYLRLLGKSEQVRGRVTVEQRNFDADVSSNDRDSIYTAANISWKHVLGRPQNWIEWSGEIFSDHADSDANRNIGYLTKLAGEFELPLKVVGYTSGQVRTLSYDDNINGLFVDKRKDDQYMLTGGIRRAVFENWSVDLQYRYTRNDSNLGLYDYDRQLSTMTAVYKF